jgi:hypothetical protein
MDRPRILRLLRIAFSALCGIVCLLLAVLWVRSLSALDSWQSHAVGKWSLHIQSAHGKAIVFAVPDSERLSELGLSRFSNVPFTHINPGNELSRPIAGSQAVTAYFNQGKRICIIPFSIVLLLVVGLSAIPWAPWRLKFSLRTLLIATTLVAVVLGLVVAMR